MKKLTTFLILVVFCACSNSKSDTETVKTKIVCNDSIEMEMFDESGDPFIVKVAGTCDTILITEE